MEAIISLGASDYEALSQHLLPPDPEAEEAAFLFAETRITTDRVCLLVREVHLVTPEEFCVRTLGHLFLDPAVHQKMIKRAHDLELALIEVHSHPYDHPGAARFSYSDRRGLTEIVPHVMWRLPKNPYAALVVAPEGFDGLIWRERHGNPEAITALEVDGQRLASTGYTLEWGWDRDLDL